MRHVPQSGFDQWFANYLELEDLKERYIDHILDDNCTECRGKLEQTIKDTNQKHTINFGIGKWKLHYTRIPKKVKEDMELAQTILACNDNIYKTVREISEGMTEEEFVNRYNKKHNLTSKEEETK